MNLAHHFCNTTQRRFHVTSSMPRQKLFWSYTTRFLPSTAVALMFSTLIMTPHSWKHSNNDQRGSRPMFSACFWRVASTVSRRTAFIAQYSDEPNSSSPQLDCPIFAPVAFLDISYFKASPRNQQTITQKPRRKKIHNNQHQDDNDIPTSTLQNVYNLYKHEPVGKLDRNSFTISTICVLYRCKRYLSSMIQSPTIADRSYTMTLCITVSAIIEFAHRQFSLFLAFVQTHTKLNRNGYKMFPSKLVPVDFSKLCKWL